MENKKIVITLHPKIIYMSKTITNGTTKNVPKIQIQINAFLFSVRPSTNLFFTKNGGYQRYFKDLIDFYNGSINEYTFNRIIRNIKLFDMVKSKLFVIGIKGKDGCLFEDVINDELTTGYVNLEIDFDYALSDECKTYFSNDLFKEYCYIGYYCTMERTPDSINQSIIEYQKKAKINKDKFKISYIPHSKRHTNSPNILNF